MELPHVQTIRAAIPVYDEQGGKLFGLLVVNSELGHEFDYIQKTIQAASREVFITNDRGDYLLHPDADKRYGFDLGHQYRVQEEFPLLSSLFIPGNRDEQRVFRQDRGGQEELVMFEKIHFDPGQPARFVSVGITLPYQAVVSEQRRLLRSSSLLALLLIAAGAVLALLFSQIMVRPLVQIGQAMAAFARGRLRRELLPLRRRDEIGALARGFDALAVQVEQSQASLRDLNRNLEQRIEERTRELQASEERQRAILATVADGIITIDAEGVVQTFNQAAETIFQYPAAEVVGRNIEMLMPEHYAAEHSAYLKHQRSTSPSGVINLGREVEGRRKDGSVFPLDLAISRMDLGGKRYYTGIVRDITERQQMDRMKNEFISTVSHELRTPLTSIRGALGLLTGGAMGELPEQSMQLLRIAGNNTERLLLLINDILDIQKIESGKVVFKFARLAVLPFLQQALADNAGYASEHGVEFVLADGIDDTHVFADQDRLMQVLNNLLSNAAKFSPEGARVEIRVARHQGTVRISVTDFGPGIPEDFRDKVFSKFTQSDSSDTWAKGGTGLGLSIAKLIVERHGGRIGFDSRVGLGSTFYFDLPELFDDSEDEGGEPQRLASAQRPCLLVVEDDADIAALLRRMLVQAGYSCDIAHDTNQARQLLDEQPGRYRAMTLDISLPGEDGLSFLKQLRAREQTRELPVVVVSVQADEARHELLGGAVAVLDWLDKPIDQARLVALLGSVVKPGRKPRVLHVEDEPDVHQLVSMMLQPQCELVWATTLEDAVRALLGRRFDLVLLDIGLPDGSGLDLLAAIEALEEPPKVVIFSAQDVPGEYAERAAAVLVKSQTDSQALLKALAAALG